MTETPTTRAAMPTPRTAIRSMLTVVICALVTLFTASGASAQDLLCKWVGRCYYESPGFKIRVVDKETGKPLADVHALAEWVQYGMNGQYPLLMAQDALSDAEGWLIFPPWGPLLGSSAGLAPGQHPVLTLYNQGYDTMRVGNYSGTDEFARVRKVYHDGQTLALAVFRGSPEERIKQFETHRIITGWGGRSLEMEQTFREPFWNRLVRVRAEYDTFPEKYRILPGIFADLESRMKRLDKKN